MLSERKFELDFSIKFSIMKRQWEFPFDARRVLILYRFKSLITLQKKKSPLSANRSVTRNGSSIFTSVDVTLHEGTYTHYGCIKFTPKYVITASKNKRKKEKKNQKLRR